MEIKAFSVNDALESWNEINGVKKYSPLERIMMSRLILLTVYKEFLSHWVAFEALVEESRGEGERAREARGQANLMIGFWFIKKWGIQVHWRNWGPPEKIDLTPLPDFLSTYEIDPYILDDHLVRGMRVSDQFSSPYSLLMEVDVRLPDKQILDDVQELLKRYRKRNQIDPAEFTDSAMTHSRSPLSLRTKSNKPSANFGFDPQENDFYIFTLRWKGHSFAEIAKFFSKDESEAGNVRKRFWAIMNFIHYYDSSWDPLASKEDLKKSFELARKDSDFAEQFYFDFDHV